jgi:branched-chain amino acid transport system substrate-binding protein
VKSKFLGPDGMDSSDLVKIGGKAVVGMYYTTAAAPASSPQAKQFGEEYKKKFSKNPEPYAAESYVATAIAIKALESVTPGGKAPTRDAVTAAIRKVKFAGMTGTIEFDEKGDPKKASYYVMQVAATIRRSGPRTRKPSGWRSLPPPPRSNPAREARDGVRRHPLRPPSRTATQPWTSNSSSASSRRSSSTASSSASCTR